MWGNDVIQHREVMPSVVYKIMIKVIYRELEERLPLVDVVAASDLEISQIAIKNLSSKYPHRHFHIEFLFTDTFNAYFLYIWLNYWSTIPYFAHRCCFEWDLLFVRKFYLKLTCSKWKTLKADWGASFFEARSIWEVLQFSLSILLLLPDIYSN